MRALIVKLSSMGDLIQALPALTDAKNAIPDIVFDWAVDESFAEIPTWHCAVNRTVQSAHRRWRKTPLTKRTLSELRRYKKTLQSTHYDAVIDAQSNTKSAIVTAASKGEKHGLDKNSVRERGAHLAYANRYYVDRNQLAIDRYRQLFAQSLGYQPPNNAPDFGLSDCDFNSPAYTPPKDDYLVFVHNASWQSKYWPREHWQTLLKRAHERKQRVLLPWGNQAEKAAAHDIAKNHSNADVLPELTLSALAHILRQSNGAICMDTGLAHLSAALNTPTVTLYGPTDPKLIGATGEQSEHLIAKGYDCAPCYKRQCNYNKQQLEQSACLQSITPEEVWIEFEKLI